MQRPGVPGGHDIVHDSTWCPPPLHAVLPRVVPPSPAQRLRVQVGILVRKQVCGAGAGYSTVELQQSSTCAGGVVAVLPAHDEEGGDGVAQRRLATACTNKSFGGFGDRTVVWGLGQKTARCRHPLLPAVG